MPTDAPLTEQTIVQVAIDLADADGIDALSMRRIADRLGVGAMSLYRHVSDRGALVRAMGEEVGRRFPYPEEPAASWREAVTTAADVDWRLYQQHPWIVLVYSLPRQGFDAAALECLEWLVAGLADGLEVDVERATEMALAVWGYVAGSALTAVSTSFARSLGASEDGSGLVDVLAGRIADPPPRLAELAGRSDAAHLADPRARLDTGLALLCAGFEASARGSGEDGG